MNSKKPEDLEVFEKYMPLAEELKMELGYGDEEVKSEGLCLKKAAAKGKSKNDDVDFEQEVKKVVTPNTFKNEKTQKLVDETNNQFKKHYGVFAKMASLILGLEKGF